MATIGGVSSRKGKAPQAGVSCPELLAAAKKMWLVWEDLSKNNPGFLGKLVLQDYAQLNEATIELPAALAKAEQRQKDAA